MDLASTIALKTLDSDCDEIGFFRSGYPYALLKSIPMEFVSIMSIHLF